MAEWPIVRLGDVIELQRGFDLPSQKRRAGGIPIVSSGGVSGYHSEARVEGPGVVTGRYGTIGEVFYLTRPFWPLNTTLFVRDFNGNDPRFVSYLLKTVDFLAYSDKAAVPGVNRNHLHEALVRLPPIEDQRQIAGILGALDDKIELNRRMAATLETTMHTAFDHLIESEPHQSWEDRGLDQIADFLNGLALQNYPAGPDGSLPVIKIAQLRSGDSRDADQAGLHVPNEYIVEDGDLLFSWSGSLECRIWSGGRGALNQHLFKVTPRQVPKWFVYQWILRHLPYFRAIAAGKATTMGHIQRRHLSEARVQVPPQDELQKAHRLIAPTLNQALHRALESRSLTVARDILLPRLLSGELEVAS